MSSSEVVFDKYQAKGAYHWVELYGSVHRQNAYTSARYGAVLEALKEHRIGQGARVLDVGCGDAALSGLIAKQLHTEIAGIDTTPLAIELARTEFKNRGLAGDFAVIDGYTYPFADAAFHAVVCSDVIEHVREPHTLLTEMWRVLAPGGVAVITTPVRYTEAPLDPMHVQEWFPEAFKEMCSKTLGVPVQLKLSHPVAWAELYALPSPILGRLVRLGINVLAIIGYNVFSTMGALRAPSTQTIIAVKPRSV